MKYSGVPKAFAYLWNSKKIWRKPAKTKVIIYDRAESEVLLTYLNPHNVEILDVRGESLNLYVLFKCLLYWKLSPIDYISQYVKCVEPIAVLTFTDNDRLFYHIKSHQKDLITVFIQNGVRGEQGDIFGFLKMQSDLRHEYHVDYMLTFGNAIGRKYSKYIDGKTHSIGSFKNNLYQSGTQKQSKSVLFLSQYRPPPSLESSPMWVYDNQPIFWKQFYSAEEFLLPLLQKYCSRNKLEFKICGCSADPIKEKCFFRSLLGNETFQLLEKIDLYSGYQKVDAMEFVVFVDSTLGYEALALGKKTAALTLRGNLLGSSDRNFGWPADLPDKGPFWTNRADEHEVERVMDYIITVSDEEWEQTRQRYIAELMEYDPGNTRFLNLMHEIAVPLKQEYEKNV